VVTVGALLGLAGLALWIRRMGFEATASAYRPLVAGREPMVSIIVPARNEERALPRLLRSLGAIDYPRLEVVVVDDRSEDRTAQVARQHGARLVVGKERPEGWGGKQWACWQGAAAAAGDVLIFTDADTWHEPASVRRMVGFLQAHGFAMASAMPYHAGSSVWERLLGPFHLLLLAVTAPLGSPTPTRKYAIGQYLAFSRAGYEAIGGHAAVKACWVEDLPLARVCLERGLGYGVFHGPRLFSVQMYDSLTAFVQGWRRNFRAGFEDSPRTAPLEVALLIAALTGGGDARTSGLAAAVAAATVVYVAYRQRWLGAFSWLGALLFPLSLALFCGITALAAYDVVFKRPQVWKGRSLSGAAQRYSHLG
jgi:hypothetical protein